MAEDKYKYALPKGFVLHGATREYVIEEVLGRGGFGITYKVKSPIIINGIRHEPYIAVKEFFPHFCSRDINKLTMTIPESIDNETKECLPNSSLPINLEAKTNMNACAIMVIELCN